MEVGQFKSQLLMEMLIILEGEKYMYICIYVCVYQIYIYIYIYIYIERDTYIYIYRERETDRQTDRHGCERETFIGYLSYMPQLGTEPATQACVLTRNETCDLSVYGMILQPTEQHWPGLVLCIFNENLRQLDLSGK